MVVVCGKVETATARHGGKSRAPVSQPPRGSGPRTGFLYEGFLTYAYVTHVHTSLDGRAPWSGARTPAGLNVRLVTYRSDLLYEKR